MATRKLRIYLISQSVNNGWNTYDSAVVAAHSEDDARCIAPNGSEFEDSADNRYGTWARSKEQIEVKLIGVCTTGIERGVICASFNAG